MKDTDNNLCYLCGEGKQHTKTCNECGLVFCPCSKIVDVDIVVDVSEKCPNCSSLDLVDNLE